MAINFPGNWGQKMQNLRERRGRSEFSVKACAITGRSSLPKPLAKAFAGVDDDKNTRKLH